MPAYVETRSRPAAQAFGGRSHNQAYNSDGQSSKAKNAPNNDPSDFLLQVFLPSERVSQKPSRVSHDEPVEGLVSRSYQEADAENG